jgi:DNA-binding transcriptional LysR family regulator
MDKLGAMQTFVRVVEAGSLTSAADSLETSLSTVVRTLAALERNLGVSLLKRTTRRIRLTDEGSQYLLRCREISAAVEEAEAQLSARRTEPVGKLSVTASVLFGRSHLVPILYEFLARHPRVSAEILLVDRVVNLIEEGIDVAIRIAHPRDASIVAIPVGNVRRVLCASEDYLHRYGTPQTPSELSEHRCVRHLGLTPRSEWHFQSGDKKMSVPINSLVTSNDIDTAIGACVQGFGLGMFLSYMVASYRISGKLKYIMEDYEMAPIPVQVIFPQARLMSNRTRAFVDECVSQLRRANFD